MDLDEKWFGLRGPQALTEGDPDVEEPQAPMVIDLFSPIGAVRLQETTRSEAFLDGSTVLSGSGIVQANGWPPGVVIPTHWWDFFKKDGSVNGYEDSAATPLNLTAGGTGNSFVPDRFNRANQAISFNGSGYAYYNGTNDDINKLGAPFSLVLWVMTGGDVTTNAHLFGIYGSSPTSYLINIGGGQFGFLTHGVSGSDTYVQAACAINQSYLVICTFDGTTGTIYVNNVPTSGAMATPRDTTQYLTIGARAGDYGNKFTGIIGLAGILKGHCWTPTECTALYQCWYPCDEANTYARLYATAPDLMKTLNGDISAPNAAAWGLEGPGEYSYRTGAMRYASALNDQPGSPGGWRQ